MKPRSSILLSFLKGTDTIVIVITVIAITIILCISMIVIVTSFVCIVTSQP